MFDHRVLSKEISKRKIHNLYYFFGEETYLAEKSVNDILLSLEGFNKLVFFGDDFETFGIDDFITSANSIPMLSAGTLFLIKNADKIKSKLQDDIITLLKNKNENRYIFISSLKNLPKDKITNYINLKGIIVEFKQLKKWEIEVWIRDYVTTNGKKITDDAINEIISKSGPYLFSIKNEIDKILLYAKYKKTITLDDVEASRGFIKKNTIYNLEDAILKMDFKLMIDSLHNLIDFGEDAIYIFNKLYYFFRKILYLKTHTENHSDIPTHLYIPDFKIQDYIKYARKFTEEDIISIINNFHYTDLDIKSGKDPITSLEILLWEISKLRQNRQTSWF